jgi:hypothetical protein
MKSFIAIMLFALLVACAAQRESGVDEAISDFVVLSELEEMGSIRTRDQFGTSELTERYAILKTRKDVYLVEFQRCPPQFNDDVIPDIRYDKNTLRPRTDTIRGCRIKKIFAIDEAGAEELELLAEASAADSG